MYMKKIRIFFFASLLLTLTFGIDSLRAEEDLPDPTDGSEEEVMPSLPEDALPEPSLGDETDSLPPPGQMINEENAKNQVNRPVEDDEVFLPTPTAQENINYAPMVQPRLESRSETDWRYGLDRRPIFSLHGGAAVYNYPSLAVEPNRTAGTVGASVRLYDIAQTVFLHAYGSFGWVSLGNVGPFPKVKDTVLHFGPMIEVGLGRRISVFGSLFRRSHTLDSDPAISGGFTSVEGYTDLLNEGWKLGVGVQYDFYIIPHGSIGIRGHIEQDMALVALTMALEPKPRKRMNLNFNEIE